MTDSAEPIRTRRAPPPFRRTVVRRVERLSPRMVRVTFTGPELGGFQVSQPAASVRLLLPSPMSDALTIPTWDRNHFVLPDGGRPTIRTFTPRRVDEAELELDIDIVVHGEGPASQWADGAETGMEAAVSGPARGYTVDADAADFLLAGDETAIPAISQLLESIPADRHVHVLLEVSDETAIVAVPEHAAADVAWSVQPPDAPPAASLASAVTRAEIGPDTRVWAAGEAAAMQRIRRHVFDDRGLPRSVTWIRGYWKHGRAGDDSDDTD